MKDNLALPLYHGVTLKVLCGYVIPTAAPHYLNRVIFLAEDTQILPIEMMLVVLIYSLHILAHLGVVLVFV
jgi:hypothetical protein